MGLVTASYIGSSILFILSLAGLSHQETAVRGNLYGMLGMAIAIIATLFSAHVGNFEFLIPAMLAGAAIGIFIAQRVEMTQMPQLVAVLHSFVGLAAVFVGLNSAIVPPEGYAGAEKVIHEIEIVLGIFIGAITFTGSLIAFGKLQGSISGKAMILPGRHALNIAMAVVCVILGVIYVQSGAIWPLVLITLIAFVLGAHLIMAIGGADMPVVVSMLNSYSGWAAAATGFMLGNDLLIVTGALVGSSGAILSYIMCRAMNRKFLAVIAGGFGTGGGTAAASSEEAGEVNPVEADEVANMLQDAKEVM